MTRVINRGTRYTGFRRKTSEALRSRKGREESTGTGQTGAADLGRRRLTGLCGEKPTIGVQAGEMTLFRRLVRDLLDAPSRHREQPFRKLVEHAKQSPEPLRCVNILLEECATNSGQDGLGLGIDALSQLGRVTLEATEMYASAETRVRARFSDHDAASRLSVHDDVWYVLLHGVARAHAPTLSRIAVLLRAIGHTSSSVRVAAVESLGDLWQRAETRERETVCQILNAIKDHSRYPDSQSAAAAVLGDLEE